MSTTDDLDARLASIRARLRNITISAPLTDAEVQAFEALHRVVLPDEYRRFVLDVAAGGRGPPAHGLVRLGEVPRDYDWSAEEQLARLARPFPLVDAWVWEDEEPLTDAKRQLRESTWGDGSLS